MRVRSGGAAAARCLLIVAAIMQIVSGFGRTGLHPGGADAVVLAGCVIAVVLLTPGVLAWLVRERPWEAKK